MITHERILSVITAVQQDFALKKVDYFGSYADGSATECSDLDLLVEFTESVVSVLTLIGLKQYLEDELQIPVDVIHAPIPSSAIIEIGKLVNVI